MYVCMNKGRNLSVIICIILYRPSVVVEGRKKEERRSVKMMMKVGLIGMVVWMTLMMMMVVVEEVSSFSLVMMGGRRGKGGLRRSLDPSSVGDETTNWKKNMSAQEKVKRMNYGKGQEITGVTLPENRKIKGWELGDTKRLACANVDGTFYAIQGDCPRCSFDLWKGDLITDSQAFQDTPRIACPTCSTTFSLKNGTHGPPLKRTGLAGFVGNLAKTATMNESTQNAQAYLISTDAETGQVFCREK